MSSSSFYMRLALKLARHAPHPPYPNPWVGCVIVKEGRIVGRGWHNGPGTSHAEVVALKQAGARARGAMVYVTLEPCCHYGRTPPCTDALIRAGVREVVFAMRDPNPQVAGRGARLLRAEGIKVTSGLCAAEARALNEVYLKFRATGLPFISVKIASSLDGKTATRTGHSKWITDPAARRHGRQFRVDHQAVLTGITTILADDPHLGPRRRGAPEPWRVVLDSALRTPPLSKVVGTGRCIIACTRAASQQRQSQLEKHGAQVWRFPGRRVPLRRLLAQLAEQGTISVLVEGGSEVLGSFFDEGLVDRAYWFISPKILGSQSAQSAIGGLGVARLAEATHLRQVKVMAVGDGWLFTGAVSRYAL
ncbi:MAG: bifunctional diaminohydroxyphosphoribosylaminopyrimidine deaminase/5-amino-6-(5-phosphoribosylamino)uracil reductase RibD, partial [Opitutaceae bacterium]